MAFIGRCKYYAHYCIDSLRLNAVLYQWNSIFTLATDRNQLCSLAVDVLVKNPSCFLFRIFFSALIFFKFIFVFVAVKMQFAVRNLTAHTQLALFWWTLIVLQPLSTLLKSLIAWISFRFELLICWGFYFVREKGKGWDFF